MMRHYAQYQYMLVLQSSLSNQSVLQQLYVC